MATRTDLDPIEQLIYDQFAADPILSNLWLYFEWNLDPKTLPYVLCAPAGGNPNIYTIPALGKTRDVITRPRRQFSVFSLTREGLADPDTGICQAISARFEAVANLPMKGGSTSLSCLMTLPWDIKYEQRKNPIAQANIWMGMGRFEFMIQKPPGVL